MYKYGCKVYGIRFITGHNLLNYTILMTIKDPVKKAKNASNMKNMLKNTVKCKWCSFNDEVMSRSNASPPLVFIFYISF